MKTYLATKHIGIDDFGHHMVSWACSELEGGVIKISGVGKKVSKVVAEREVVAELTAIKYLLFKKEVFGSYMNSCFNGLRLFTSGQVKQLAEGK